MKSAFLACCALVGLVMPSALQAEEFKNTDVIALSQAGLGDDVILSKIGSLPCNYDVSTNSIIVLRTSGVSNEVIAAMVERCFGASGAQGVGASNLDPTQKRNPGIYIDVGMNDQHNLIALRPTNAIALQRTGNGSLLFPFRSRLGLAGEVSAQASGDNNPEFYFYFENDDARVSDFGVSGTFAAQSPNEFSLIEFRVKDGQRQLTVGKGDMFSTNIGLDPKDTVSIVIESIGDGIFRVAPNQPLSPGEYGFVLRMGSESYRIFDFGVR